MYKVRNIECLKSLYKVCFPEKSPAFLDNFIRQDNVIVLQTDIDGKIAGFIISLISPDCADIIDIGTAPEHRNHGIASKLIVQLCELVCEKGAKTIYLEVAIDNVAAMRLYNKIGFVEYNHRKDYYQTTKGLVDGICMRKALLL